MKTIKSIKTTKHFKTKHPHIQLKNHAKKTRPKSQDYFIAPSTMHGFFNYSI